MSIDPEDLDPAERARVEELAEQERAAAKAANVDELAYGDVKALVVERVLELNGFNAVRTEALNVASALASLPLSALDAAIDYNRRACARLALDTHRDAAAALKVAERQTEYMSAIRRYRRGLEDLEQRLAARDAITRQ